MSATTKQAKEILVDLTLFKHFKQKTHIWQCGQKSFHFIQPCALALLSI